MGIANEVLQWFAALGLPVILVLTQRYWLKSDRAEEEEEDLSKLIHPHISGGRLHIFFDTPDRGAPHTLKLKAISRGLSFSDEADVIREKPRDRLRPFDPGKAIGVLAGQTEVRIKMLLNERLRFYTRHQGHPFASVVLVGEPGTAELEITWVRRRRRQRRAERILDIPQTIDVPVISPEEARAIQEPDDI
ncbi:hypothetical protein [Euryhalocaulis caribicus]|uniref:hypothetical protein n=1 Tax=Euryhalocaulis caribicus TaxID=1161401 RepID=UPI00126844A1|nr:hypothetical protein [Euryhalocaulis caribicus]